MKRCRKCKKWKDKSEFGKNLAHKDGLQPLCKKCQREYARNYYGFSKRYLYYEERHRVVEGVKEKRCNKCRKWKAESEFYRIRCHKDGLAALCKQCADKATNKVRRRRLAVRN